MDPLLTSRDDRFHEAFHVSPVGNVIIRCVDSKVVEINAACLRILGCERQELVDQPASALRFSPAIDLHGEQGDAPIQREITFIRKDGSAGHGLCFHHPMDLRGERHALATLIDITERKQMEQSLRDSTARPGFVDMTAQKRAEEAQVRSQKMEALATLAGGIAHDFNNLLLAISGNTRLAITDLPDDHPVQQSLGQIAQASSRAADLVRRILAFSRQPEGRREVRPLRPILQEAVRLVRRGLPATIELRAQLGDTPPVAVDPLQIHEILTNLAANAMHAIGDRSGVIEVTLHQAEIDPGIPGLPGGEYACLSFRDNGSGMSRQTLERIFDPFFTTQPAGTAVGLGLSVVHGIVQNLGGTILVDSTPGEGTKFDIYFPAARQEDQAPPPPSQQPSPGQGQRVLYVDDEEALVILLTRVLERLGYQVLSFTDPAKALAAVHRDPQCVDVVVTDLSMHGMTGFDLARAILAVRPELPVLLTSGHVRAEDREIARECGIREVILKPNTVEELGHALNRLFAGYARA